MKRNRPSRLLLFLALLPAVALSTSCHDKGFLVDKIVIDPARVEMFVGDFQRMTVLTYPHFADNEDELEFSVDDPSIALCDGTVLLGRRDGTTHFVATCGDVSSTCRIRVFEGRFDLNGKGYGVSRVEGTLYRNGTSSPKEIAIRLYHDADTTVQYFEARASLDKMGELIDFMTPGMSAYVTGYTGGDNGTDGYIISAMNSGFARVTHPDWTDAEGVKLTTGRLRIYRKGGENGYGIQADFMLSNDFDLKVDWVGTVPLKTE